MRDTIVIQGLELQVRVGCSDEERRNPQRIVMNVGIGLNEKHRTARGDLSSTVCWKIITDEIVKLTAAGNWVLIEDLGEDVSQLIFENSTFVSEVFLEIQKNALAETRWVGVRMKRLRQLR